MEHEDEQEQKHDEQEHEREHEEREQQPDCPQKRQRHSSALVVHKLLPSYHPRRQINRGPNRLQGRDLFQAVLSFLRQLSHLDYCPSIQQRTTYKNTQCACLHQLHSNCINDDQEDSQLMRMIASHVCWFCTQGDMEQRKMEIEWHNQARDTAEENSNDSLLLYQLSLKPTREYDEFDDQDPAADVIAQEQQHVTPIFVCANALQLVYGFGGQRFLTSRAHAAMKTLPPSMVGRKQKQKPGTQQAEDNLVALLRRLEQYEGEPVTNDDDDVIVELPSRYSRRGVYQQYALENGWLVSIKGNLAKKPDPDWNADNDRPHIVPFEHFQKFWDEHFPNLRVCRSKKLDGLVGPTARKKQKTQHARTRCTAKLEELTTLLQEKEEDLRPGVDYHILDFCHDQLSELIQQVQTQLDVKQPANKPPGPRDAEL